MPTRNPTPGIGSCEPCNCLYCKFGLDGTCGRCGC